MQSPANQGVCDGEVGLSEDEGWSERCTTASQSRLILKERHYKEEVSDLKSGGMKRFREMAF